MNNVQHCIDTIDHWVRCWEPDDGPREGWQKRALRSAAQRYKRTYPEKALDVIETIGSWPSSEPQLAALQAVWP